MLSVASLLNPVPSNPRIIHLPSSPSYPNHTTSSSLHSSFVISQPVSKKQKMAKDGAVFIKGKPKGQVNFRPFENLDKESTDAAATFHITPIGKIEEYPRHIPYNSDKKDFLKKTGRESFEVFQYNFRVPNSDKNYLVLWDYNIGLVRITPFFKCCNYSKTTPAKMLNLNQGLKEITHSITGGSLSAQGYWMPYSCAYAVCATFCAHISGALIPLFGPDFPSHCIPTSSPHYGRMVIDPAIIAAATHEAHASAQHYSALAPPSSPFPPNTSHASSAASSSPMLRSLMSTPSPASTPGGHFSKRLRLKRSYRSDSPVYVADKSDTDGSDTSPGPDGYIHTPPTPSSTYTSTPISLPSTLTQARYEWTSTPHAHSMPMSSINSMASPALSSSNSGSRFELPHARDFGMGDMRGQLDQQGRTIAHKNTLSYSANPFLSAIPRSIVSDYSTHEKHRSENMWRPSNSSQIPVQNFQGPNPILLPSHSLIERPAIAHNKRRTIDIPDRKIHILTSSVSSSSNFASPKEMDSDYDFCRESPSSTSSAETCVSANESLDLGPRDTGYHSGRTFHKSPTVTRGRHVLPSARPVPRINAERSQNARHMMTDLPNLWGAEKNAALLLMKLSVTDNERFSDGGGGTRDSDFGGCEFGEGYMFQEDEADERGHRLKRRRGRATSV